VPPLVGFIAQASSLRWSFAFVALFGALITVLVSQTKSTPSVLDTTIIDDF
jgi:hypothetical protein